MIRWSMSPSSAFPHEGSTLSAATLPSLRAGTATALRRGGIAAWLAGPVLDCEVNMRFCRPRNWFVRSMGVVAGIAAMTSAAPGAFAQSFPFGHELVLDANPMRGANKGPVLD